MGFDRDVYELLKKIMSLGCKPYVVGGAVRDHLLGLKSLDIDVAIQGTEATLSLICQECSLAKEMISPYGTLNISLGHKEIQLSLFRREQEYLDSRHPSKISFKATLEDDLRRRDFIQNALAWSVEDEELIDLFGGAQSLFAPQVVIETIQEARSSFQDDALRMIRAFRLWGRIGLKKKVAFSADIKDALRTERQGIVLLNPQVLHKEMLKIWQEDNAARVLEQMDSLGILELVFPAISDQGLPKHWTQELEVARTLTERLLVFAQLCNVEPLILYGINYPVKLINRVGKMYSVISLLEKDQDDVGVKRSLRNFSPADIESACHLYGRLSQEPSRLYVKICKMGETIHHQQLNINIELLRQAGYQGHRLGDALDYLLDCVYTDEANNNKKKLLQMLKKRGI